MFNIVNVIYFCFHNMAVSSINTGMNRLRKEILERIETVKNTLVQDMRLNFYKNVNKVLLLTASVKKIEMTGKRDKHRE